MPLVLGASDPLTWAAARDKVRGDLWRPGAAGIPDDQCNRGLHASILEIESDRRWLWLEQILSTIELEAESSTIDLLPAVGAIHSLAVFNGATPRPDILSRDQLQSVRESSPTTHGIPSCYALSDRTIYLDTTAPAGTKFELIFDAQTPPRLEDAVDSPSITLTLHQQAVLAGAKAYVAAEYLHDDAKAARNRAAFEKHLYRLQDRDDQQRVDLGGGSIVPDDLLYIAAHGQG